MLMKMGILATVLIVTSCSKAPGSGGGGVGSVIEAQFIDDPVKGLEFVPASGTSGKTGSQGKFNCIRGEKVGFKIAGLELGEAVCGEKIFVDDLVSDEAGHSPEKVAAIIQSFAVAGSDEFDLTTAIEAMDANELSALSFAGNDAAFLAALDTKVDAIVAAVPALSTVIEAKDPVAMRTLLDAAIAQYSNLADALKAILGEIDHLPSATFSEVVAADKMITLTGTLTSNDPDDECYDFVQARASVSQEAADKPFKFVLHKTASFDALDAYNDATNDCTDEDWCDQGSEMPAPKLISSSSISFFSEVEESGTGYTFESKSTAVLTAAIEGGEFKVTGTVQEDGSYSETDGESGTFSCKYSVTSAEVEIPAEGPASEDDDAYPHVDLPAGATGTYSLPASPSIFCSTGTQALLASGALPTSFNVAISGQNVTVSSTSSVVETWTKEGSWYDEFDADSGQHAVYFDDTNNWHLDLTYNVENPDEVGIYIYHIPSGDFDNKFCSFQLTRN